MSDANKTLLANRFHEAITTFHAKAGVNIETLATTLGKPVSTVYKWLGGSQSPRRADLKAICHKLNWDYDQMFVADVLMDKIINRNFLSFDALNARFLEMRQRNVFDALTLTAVAGTMAMSYLVAKNLKCEFIIDEKLNCQIHTLDPRMDSIFLNIAGNVEPGLCVQMYYFNGKVASENMPLNEKTLKYLHVLLTKYGKESEDEKIGKRVDRGEPRPEFRQGAEGLLGAPRLAGR